MVNNMSERCCGVKICIITGTGSTV